MADSKKHTPGPWHVGYRGMDIGCTNAKIGGHAKLFDIRGWGYLTGNGHGGLGLPHEEAVAIQEANARLVAAAPDLLEALKALQKQALQSELNSPSHEWGMEALALTEAAIARAEGRS